ncbi:hypothetical protein ACFE04_011244 [Oxalis oulophora]
MTRSSLRLRLKKAMADRKAEATYKDKYLAEAKAEVKNLKKAMVEDVSSAEVEKLKKEVGSLRRQNDGVVQTRLCIYAEYDLMSLPYLVITYVVCRNQWAEYLGVRWHMSFVSYKTDKSSIVVVIP